MFDYADFGLPIVDLVAECPMSDFVEFLDPPILEFDLPVFPMPVFESLDLPSLEFELLVFPMLEFELPESPKIEVVGPIESFDLLDPIDLCLILYFMELKATFSQVVLMERVSLALMVMVLCLNLKQALVVRLCFFLTLPSPQVFLEAALQAI